jgi:cellulose synthase/poly-beta-1,6-N-acetylglucosamine synthase-like glycosyltransferase
MIDRNFALYRFFEILPGVLSWLTLILLVVLSWLTPVAVAIFIILFDIYWLMKTIYLSFHLRSTYKAMKANLKVDWLKKLEELKPARAEPSAARSWQNLYHLVIFPFSTEPYEVVRESFESLAKTNYPLDKMLVVLAAEERAGQQAQDIARKIEAEFGGRFHKFLATTHPKDLPGEIPGKGSNQAWAGREAERLLLQPLGIPAEKVMVSVFDIDTHVYKEYFGRLTYVFLTADKPLRSVYQPVPLFTNNIYQAPALARVVAFSCTFWQMMQQARPERLTTFSSQSIPFSVLKDIGFWTTNIVSEDSHVFWQGYLRYDGDFRVVPLEYPVSMDANVTPKFWGTLRSLYKQQRRWGWGVENVPYMLTGFLNNPRISRLKKWYWSFHTLEGFHSWATNALMIFALGWLPTLIGGGGFEHTLLSYSLPQITRFIIGLSMIGVATSAMLSILLLPPRPKGVRRTNYIWYVLEWILIPVTLIVFGALPGLEAQTRLMLGGRWRLGFWVTPKGRYAV